MAHCIVAEAEAILDKEYPVLDKGFVRLVDYLGSDERVVQAARVSYGSGTKSYREDAALIDYLLRNEHTSPFEQVVLTFHVKLPIFVARQMIRHRTARLNEISGRYSVMKDDFYVPAPEDVALQSSDNKQGRSNEPLAPEAAEAVRDLLRIGQKESYDDYLRLVNQGIARELARINLPLSLYTEWYWQIDLHNLFHFLKLRLDAHAQKEIREYAQVMFEITKKVAPRCCESFEQHILGGLRFSKEELAELKRRLGLAVDAESLSGKALERFEEKLRSGRQL
ncbi:FAD-dependent thymidylate synthase [Gracilinema caldarium]|uniref:FAD-dependent thymidylate synthase n=1 Tax=Gracilinema caldarium TaxID=215591 RepID=UPI0026F2E632|nr:FAD-dependent thymidylate synthase [Gracilinema caldarium]